MTRYRIPELASKYMDYDMIRHYAGLPDFPESRIRLLFSFLSRSPMAAESSELYSLALSLVQLGMDTHDHVDTQTGDSSGIVQMRVRQLRVLAGDYFSSRFYQLLAGAGHIGMVRVLGQAICETNRLKTDLYVKASRGTLAAEEYLALLSAARTALFERFTILLDEKLQPLWQELLLSLARIEILHEEWSSMAQEERFAGSWGYWHVMEHGSEEDRRHLQSEHRLEPYYVKNTAEKYSLRSILSDKLLSLSGQYRVLAARLESDGLAQEVLAIGESLADAAAASSSMIGEMR